MATSASNPREIQDRDKKAKATTGAQHPSREGDAVRVRTADGWDSGPDGESAGGGQQNETSNSKS
jgi:hypothetical protein